MDSLGKHYIADYYNCNRQIIDSMERVEEIMNEAVRLSGARVISPFFHRFSPQGVSGVIVIAESHFAIHTWPEHDYAAVDLFSCADFNVREALEYVEKAVQSSRRNIYCLKRGVMGHGEKGDSFSELSW